MAALHSALQALAPIDYQTVPTTGSELDQYVADLLTNAQAIVESIPIPAPDGSITSRSGSSPASRASEITSSPARSEPPTEEYVTLQKEWGKPLKLSQKENLMGMSVYKVGGKDGRGAWFARRSVHEGLGFARFRKAFEKEFPASLAVQGGPGEGNIRGIGAETRIENMDVPNRGHIDVYQLTAQFPGPTTPRDFVTFLVTSSKTTSAGDQTSDAPKLAPRQYMIISKPCNHPETQPRSGFVRGQYESVEFIREIPRNPKISQSSSAPHHSDHKHDHSLEQNVLIKNTEKKVHSFPLDGQTNEHGDKQNSTSEELSTEARRRSQTVGVLQGVDKGSHNDGDDPEENPVEWIMVTRSDPGGSVPRFMVDRGTPASICADAVKFLDWACQRDTKNDAPSSSGRPAAAQHRDSYSDLEANGRLAGIRESEDSVQQDPAHSSHPDDLSRTSASNTPVMTPASPQTPASSGIFASISGAVGAYAPQVILNRLPGADTAHEAESAEAAKPALQSTGTLSKHDDEDAASIASTVSFASADSHLTSSSGEQPSISSQSPDAKASSKHEKSLAKLSQQKADLDTKHASQKAKLVANASKDAEAQQAALQKLEEKHAKEVKKHEERYQRELTKVAARKEKEAKKAEQKQKKQADKDEKTKLTRERDEARAELEALKKEQELMVKQIGTLQRENTDLAARLGASDDTNSTGSVKGTQASTNDPKHGQGRTRGTTLSELKEGNFFGRSRSPSLMSKQSKKEADRTPTHSPDSTRT